MGWRSIRKSAFNAQSPEVRGRQEPGVSGRVRHRCGPSNPDSPPAPFYLHPSTCDFSYSCNKHL